MEAVAPNAVGRPGKVLVWVSYILSAIPVLMMTFSAIMKFFPAVVAEGFEHLGWPLSLSVPLAIVELACVIIYLIPRTAVLGAILIAAYLGGATATHVRVGDSSFFMPALLGVFAWAGLWIRDRRVSDLIPFRN